MTPLEGPMSDMREINTHVINEFRANAGRLTGPMQGAPVLLLTTTGRRSGMPFTTPVGFIDAGGRLAVAAANGGADSNPDWYQNLLADPNVTIEIPGAKIVSRAVPVDGVERDELLAQLSEALPGMSEHVAATDRDIPVVVLTEAG